MALIQLDRPLSSDLQQSLHQRGNLLTTHPSAAIAQLPTIASQDPELYVLYESAHLTLQQYHQTQQQQKPMLLGNVSGFNLNLGYLASQIFQATNSVQAAQNYLSLTQPLPPKAFSWDKADRIMSMASGGAFLGGLIAQVPGAIMGSLIAAFYGYYTGFMKPSTK